MSTIPLVALHANDQQPSPLQMYAQAQAIQGAQQERQLRDQQIQATTLENQQRQLQLQDQNTLRDAAKGLDWSDPKAFDTLIQKGEQGGVSPQTLSALTLQRAQYKEQLAKTDTATLAAEQTRNQRFLGHIDAIRNGADPKAQAAQILADGDIKDPGMLQKVQAMAAGQYVPQDDELKQLENGLLDHKTQMEEAQKKQQLQNETNTANAKVTEAQNESTKLQATLPGGALENPEQKFLRINSAQAQGQPISAEDKAFLASYQKNKLMVPQFNINMQNASGAGSPAADVAKKFGLTPEAFDQQAEKYYQTGTLPPVGRGGNGQALNKALMNRAAELHQGGSLAAGSAEYAANKQSLESLQKNFDQVTAFENTAGKNLDTFLNTAKKIVDSGSPWINKPIRAVASGALGSDDMAAYNAARTTALTEIAKVLNSSNASGVLSDSARTEVSGLIGPNATLKQIYSAANILKQDMANRHQAYQDQIGDIKGRMGGSQPNTSTPQSANTGGTLPKSLTVQQIAAYAKAHGVSEDEVKRQAKAKGIQVP